MAKKNSKKPTKKPAAKKASKAPAKSSGKKPTGKQAAAPKPVTTGRGPTPGEIGAAVVAHLNSGAHSDVPLWNKYWSDAVESVEGRGMSWRGRKAMEAKCMEWVAQHDVLGCRATGPFVGASGFAVHMEIEVRPKAGGDVMRMKEVGVYTVKDGKVVREEFMYGGC